MVEDGCLKMPWEHKSTSQSVRKMEEMLGRRRVQNCLLLKTRRTRNVRSWQRASHYFQQIQDSAVSTVTRLRAGRSRSGQENSLFYKSSRPALCPTSLLFRTPPSFPVGKAVEAWSWPPTSNQHRSSEWVELCLYSSYMPSWRGKGQLYLYPVFIHPLNMLLPWPEKSNFGRPTPIVYSSCFQAAAGKETSTKMSGNKTDASNTGGRSSQTQLRQLRCLFAINGKLHVSALIGHRQVFSQINLGSKNMYIQINLGSKNMYVHTYFWILG
jgi:hypothetical protein